MPDEYISREAALMKLMQDGCSAKNLQSISDMPAADVVEVVRCRNCAKHYVVLGRDMCAKDASGSGDHLIGLSATLPDAFCSRGVRKDGGENDVSG